MKPSKKNCVSDWVIGVPLPAIVLLAPGVCGEQSLNT